MWISMDLADVLFPHVGVILHHLSSRVDGDDMTLQCCISKGILRALSLGVCSYYITIDSHCHCSVWQMYQKNTEYIIVYLSHTKYGQYGCDSCCGESSMNSFRSVPLFCQ